MVMTRFLCGCSQVSVWGGNKLALLRVHDLVPIVVVII